MNSPEILDKLQKSVQVSFASFSAFAEDSTGRCLSSESDPLPGTAALRGRGSGISGCRRQASAGRPGTRAAAVTDQPHHSNWHSDTVTERDHRHDSAIDLGS